MRLRQALRHRNLALGAVLTGAVLALALVGILWTPYAPTDIDIAARLGGPSAAHWLGTDYLGRDMLSLVMLGAQNALGVALAAVAIGLAAGVPLGLAAAATAGSLVDEAAGRLIDLVFAFPAILSALLITALAGPGALTAILAIGIFNIAVFARVMRGAARQVYGRDFVTAAVALGRTRFDVALRHVLPNAAAPLIVQATIQFAVAILAEAALSYLGLGTRPPQPSWGKMLFEAQRFMHLDPAQAIIPGLAIALTVLGLNLLGDGLRDALDPRLRLGGGLAVARGPATASTASGGGSPAPGGGASVRGTPP
ncbi:MAG: ABC transporter permease subunit [Alphaproteobacteria bacterium]|nr:ABC transporter permease subunit [Alphaproteobacteria bacterium]